MKRTISGSLLVALVLVLTLTPLALSGRPAHAQNGDVCYAVADNGGVPGSEDTLVTLDKVTGVTTLIGYTGTTNIEAIAFELGAETLFAADGEQLGTLDLATAAFTARPEAFGTGSGALGEIEFDDVDGLTVDPATDILYGTHRQNNPQKDVMLQINSATGGHVPDAFGPGVDYVVVEGDGVLNDVDDIAVDPITGQMYAATNNGGAGGVLVSVDKATGAGVVVGPFGVDDIEGLAYFNDGQLYGSTGKYSTGPDTTNELYLINENTGAATFVAPFSQYVDIEALDCLTEPTSITLSGIGAAADPALNTVLLVALAALAALTLVVARRLSAPK